MVHLLDILSILQFLYLLNAASCSGVRGAAAAGREVSSLELEGGPCNGCFSAEF